MCTSDVVCFDGDLACVNIPNSANLNDVLLALANAICDFTPPVPDPVNAIDVAYTGDLTFPCFTMTATNLEEAVVELATQICTVNSSIAALTACDILSCELNPDKYGCATGIYVVPATLNEILVDIFDALCEGAQARAGISNVSGETGSAATGNYNAANGRNILRSFSTVFGDPDKSWRISGGVPTYSGLTLDLVIDDGAGGESSYVVDGWLVNRASETIVLTPNADNYVDVSDSGVYTITAVGIGAPAPATVGMRMYMATTDGVGVTAFSNLLNDFAIDGVSIADDAIITRHIADLNITGAKLENIGAGATVGETDFFQLVYDTKGRVTSASTKIDIGYSVALADGHILQYDLGNDVWKNVAIAGTIYPVGTNNQTLHYSGAVLAASSYLTNTGSAVGIGVQDGESVISLAIGEAGIFGMQLAKPSGVIASPTTGGALGAGTYYYVIITSDGGGNTVPSAEVSASVDGATTTAISVNWTEQQTASTYTIWRGVAPGVYTDFQTKQGRTNDFIDDGAGWNPGVYSANTDTEAYGMYLTADRFRFGDRKNPANTEMFAISNQGTSYRDLVYLRQSQDAGGAGPSVAMSVKVETTTNTGETNHGIYIRQVSGAGTINYGVTAVLAEDFAGDNVGFAANVSNPTGDAFAFYAAAGQSHFLDQIYVSDTGAGTPNAAALIEFSSTTKGVLFPRMTAAQGSAITPTNGLVIYATDTDGTFLSVGFWGYENGAWVKL